MYVLVLEDWERDRQAGAASGNGVPSYAQMRTEFDTALLAEPKRQKPISAEQLELRRALGVA